MKKINIKKIIRIFFLPIPILSILISPRCFADTVYLKNGNKQEGKIIKKNDAFVVIRVPISKREVTPNSSSADFDLEKEIFLYEIDKIKYDTGIIEPVTSKPSVVSAKKNETSSPSDLEPDGFRGIKWGTSLSLIANMEQTKTDNSQKYPGVIIEEYRRTNDNLQIGEAKIDEIIYMFWRKQFHGVYIIIKGEQNLALIQKYVFDKYTVLPSPVQVSLVTNYILKGTNAVGIFACMKNMSSGVLDLYSKEFNDELIASNPSSALNIAGDTTSGYKQSGKAGDTISFKIRNNSNITPSVQLLVKNKSGVELPFHPNVDIENKNGVIIDHLQQRDIILSNGLEVYYVGLQPFGIENPSLLYKVMNIEFSSEKSAKIILKLSEVVESWE